MNLNERLRRLTGDRDKLKKLLQLLLGLLAMVLIVTDGRQFLKQLSFGATLKLLRTIPAGQLAVFLTAGLAAVWLTFLYDYAALRRLGHPIPLRRIMRVSWIANTFNNVAGFGGLGGAGARLLLYRRDGLKEKAVQRMSLLIIPATITGLGWLMLLNMTGQTGITPLLHQYRWLPVLIAGFAAYIPVYCWVSGVSISRSGISVTHSDDPGETHTRILLSIISAVDWSAAALVLWLILDRLHPGVSPLAAAGLFSIATAAGLASLIPGGLGSFDLMLLSGLHAYGFTTDQALAALLLFRFFYYIVPLGIGALMAVNEASPFVVSVGRRVAGFLSPPAASAAELPADSPSVLLGDLASKALYFLVLGGGLLLVVSAATPGLPDRIRFMSDLFSMPLLRMSSRLSLFIGLAVLLMADDILLRLRRAWTVCLLLLGAGGLFTFLKGFDFEELLYLMVVFVLLLLSKPVFTRISAPTSPQRLLRPLLLTALMAGFYILSGQPHPIAFLRTHSGLSLLHFTPKDYVVNGTAALAGAWICYAVWLRAMPAPQLGSCPPSASDFDRLRALLDRHPGNSHTHLLYLKDKRFFWTPGDTAMIPYQRSGECLIALGGPLGPPERWVEALEAFRSFSERYGLIPVFYQAPESLLPDLHDLGFSFFKLGEEAFATLTDLSFDSSHFKGLRNVRNRMERDGYSFEVVSAGDSASILPELRHISDVWLAGRQEKQFSLGFFDPDYLSLAPLALLRAPDGHILAFASLMPAYHGNDEISVDLMRFLPECPNGTMDYLFFRLLGWASESGYGRFNFGMAPLSNVGRQGYPAMAERLAGLLFKYGSRVYSFAGLYQYKKKFHPDWRPRYLAYPRNISVTRILLAAIALINRDGKRSS